jgi:hypothetical protein
MTTELRRIMQELLDAVNVLASSASEIMASTTQLAAGRGDGHGGDRTTAPSRR